MLKMALLKSIAYIRRQQMNSTMATVVQCVLLIPTIATIGAFWFGVFATIFNAVFAPKPTDKEIEEKTR